MPDLPDTVLPDIPCLAFLLEEYPTAETDEATGLALPLDYLNSIFAERGKRFVSGRRASDVLG